VTEEQEKGPITDKAQKLQWQFHLFHKKYRQLKRKFGILRMWVSKQPQDFTYQPGKSCKKL